MDYDAEVKAAAATAAETYATQPVCEWNTQTVSHWLRNIVKLSKMPEVRMNGLTLLALNESDIRDILNRHDHNVLNDLKLMWLAVQRLQALHSIGRCPAPNCLVAQLAEANAAVAAAAAALANASLVNINAAAAASVNTSSSSSGSNNNSNSSNNNINNNKSNNCASEPPRLLAGQLSVAAHHQRQPSAAGLPLHASPSTAAAAAERCSSAVAAVPLAGYISLDSMTASAESFSPPASLDGRTSGIPPEFFKTAISLGYSFLVTWITSFVMVIVHERVPDMKRYPPLPDIFLDNVPHIPWAFHMCELTGTLLFGIWACVCILHKYRMVLLRRFFALAGTVFLLRCVTMLITSLSVPGTHLQCNQNDYAIDDTELSTTDALELRITRAYTIWSGLGMSIQGVRTCGDYMFSGHTVALTLLNFFITEYTPRNLYFLHTLSWLLNMFGIFFILAAHEHYSIDVFVAFYITSRLFLYYHTLANNQALMSRDSNRTRIWFPMFSYFESSVDGIIPNDYDTLGDLLAGLWHWLMALKDACMLTARRYWIFDEALVKTGAAGRDIKVPAATTTPMATMTSQAAAAVVAVPAAPEKSDPAPQGLEALGPVAAAVNAATTSTAASVVASKKEN